MKLLAVLLTLGCLSAAAPAATAAPQPEGRGCIALSGGASRVAATVADPADCCNGRMLCSRFLSTTVVVKPQRELRT